MKYRLAILVEFEAPSYSEARMNAHDIIQILRHEEVNVVAEVGPDLPSHIGPFGLTTA